MRGRSPVTVWRPPARAHTLAHTQSNCRVDGSAAWALRAVQRRVGTSRIAFYNPCFRLHGCVLRDARPPPGDRGAPLVPVPPAGRARGIQRRRADRAPRRLGRRPARRDKFRGLRVFRPVSGFPGTSVVANRPTWTSARPTPRTRKASLRLVARRAAVRQPARSPGSGVFGSTLGSPTGVSLRLPRVSRLATTNSDVTARPIIPTHAANPARNREPTVRGASHTRRRRRSTRV